MGVTSQMPAQDDDVSRKQRDLQRALRENTFARTAAATQIGAGGLLVNNGGSITISGSGALNVGSGALNSAGSITAGTTIGAGTAITAGTTINANGTITGGAFSTAGSISGNAISGGSLATTGNVHASGQVISDGIINSTGTKANTVTVGFSAVYADSSGNFGANTSSRRYKQDITPIATDTHGFLGLQTYKFRYIANVEALGDAAPWDYGLIAEEVVQVAPWACFYEADGVTVRGINYDRLIIAAMNVLQDHERRLQAAGL